MRSTSSFRLSSRSLRTALVSTSRSRLDPPCRSRPSTMWRCAQAGHLRITFSGKKLGTANRHTTSAVSRIPAAFHRVKNNMDSIVLASPPSLPRQRPGERRRRLAVVLHWLALGPHFGDHRAHLSYPHAVGDLDLDLVIVDHLGDLADEPAIGHHAVSAAQRLDHVPMLLRPLLLRPQHQEVH